MMKRIVRNRPNKTKLSLKTLMWQWLGLALLISLFAMGLIFLNLYSSNTKFSAQKTQIIQLTKSDDQQQDLDTDSPNKPTNNPPTFDFYTLLAKQSVPAGPAKPEDSTPKSPPPKPKSSNKENSTNQNPRSIVTDADHSAQAEENQSSDLDDQLSDDQLSNVSDVNDDQSPVAANDQPSVSSNQPAIRHTQSAQSIELEQRAKQSIELEQRAKQSIGNYVLQVASLRRYSDADRLKAKLILQGYLAYIHSVQIGHITWNRVNIGPYKTLSQAQSIHKNLLAQNIASILLRSDFKAES